MADAKKKRGRKKGTAKTGGRKAGTPNRSLRVLEDLDQAGLNLAHELVEAAKALPPQDRFAALMQIVHHAYPKIREVDCTKLDPEPAPLPSPPPAAPAAAQQTLSAQERIAKIRALGSNDRPAGQAPT